MPSIYSNADYNDNRILRQLAEFQREHDEARTAPLGGTFVGAHCPDRAPDHDLLAMLVAKVDALTAIVADLQARMDAGAGTVKNTAPIHVDEITRIKAQLFDNSKKSAKERNGKPTFNLKVTVWCGEAENTLYAALHTPHNAAGRKKIKQDIIDKLGESLPNTKFVGALSKGLTTDGWKNLALISKENVLALVINGTSFMAEEPKTSFGHNYAKGARDRVWTWIPAEDELEQEQEPRHNDADVAPERLKP